MADEPLETAAIAISECRLGLSRDSWSFAEENAEAIAAHWARARIERPKLFDGIVHVLTDWQLQDGAFSGTLVRTDFKSFLYWRETGYPEVGVRDAFGSSLIRSADGAVLLGRQTEGNMNSGLAYPLSGMIDADDVGTDGVDIDASVARELGEESGLKPGDFVRVPGYLLTLAGPLISIAIEWQSRLDADALRGQMLKHIANQSAPELADIVIVRRRDEIDAIAMPAYARALLSRILRA